MVALFGALVRAGTARLMLSEYALASRKCCLATRDFSNPGEPNWFYAIVFDQMARRGHRLKAIQLFPMIFVLCFHSQNRISASPLSCNQLLQIRSGTLRKGSVCGIGTILAELLTI